MRDIYINCHEAIIGSSPPDATSDIPVQLSKLAVGLYSLRYIASTKRNRGDSNIAVDGDDDIYDKSGGGYNTSKYDGKEDGDVYDFNDGKDDGDNNRKVMISLNEDGGNNNSNSSDDLMLEKYTIAPYMFKHVISQGNHEFSSGRQQDVSEYYQYLLQVIAKTEKIHYPRYQTTINYNTAKLFEFHIETRYQCLATGTNSDDDEEEEDGNGGVDAGVVVVDVDDDDDDKHDDHHHDDKSISFINKNKQVDDDVD